MPPLDLTITDVAFGGKGIARLDGKVYFVADALPGDRVEVQITEDHARYADAEIINVITASPDRVAAPCPYLHSCGGCLWQEASYPHQLLWKENFVRSALRRIGKIDATFPITMHGSPQSFGYRNRIHLKATVDVTGALHVGFYREGSHELIVIEACSIAEEPLNLAIKAMANLTFPELVGQHFKMELQSLALPYDPAQIPVTAVIFPQDKKLAPLFEKASQRLIEQAKLIWAGVITEANEAPFLPYDDQFGVHYYTRPGVFQQVNLPQNRRLRELLLQRVTELGIKNILDLFCGSGNLSMHLAAHVDQIVGIEYSVRAIECARFAIASNRITNATYIAADAEKHMWGASKNRVKHDLVLVDPPREGMFKTNIPLLNLGPDYIAYVSCDPATLARDLGRLCTQYAIISIDCFDFFPQTTHVETMVWLKKITK